MTASRYKVILSRADTYDVSRIKELVDQGVTELLPGRNFYSSRILLKPNLISSRASALACTDGRIIRSVAEWFLDQGGTIAIGDSPAFGSATAVLKKHGILSCLKGLDIEVQHFKSVVPKTLSHGMSIGVAEEALTCDYFINLPKIKAHSQMFVTMAVKNLFGIVCGMRKAIAHMKNGDSHLRFAELMLDLAELLPESVSIVDGIDVMHRHGPVNGERLNLGCLAVGDDPVAVDTALLEVLEQNSRPGAGKWPRVFLRISLFPNAIHQHSPIQALLPPQSSTRYRSTPSAFSQVLLDDSRWR